MIELWTAFWRWAYEQFLAKATQPDGGIGIVKTLGTGYSVEEACMERVDKLRLLCLEATTNPAWIAHDITGDGVPETFCNRAVRFIAQGMGFFDFRSDEDANQLISSMSSDTRWQEEHDLMRVSDLAQKGVLVIIGLMDYPHGHVVVAAPEPAEDSSTWGGKVPMVAQVGTAKVGNGVKRLSAAFKAADGPRLRAFILMDSIS